MSETNISPALPPRQPSTIQPAKTEESEKKEVQPPIDFLVEPSSTQELRVTVSSQKTGQPELQTPSKSVSLLDYSSTMDAAVRDLQHQLNASDYVDQATRRQSSHAAAIQAQAVSDSIEARDNAVKKVEIETDNTLKEFQSLLDIMQAQTKEQQARTDALNAGNAREAQKCKELNDAYNEYMKNLASIEGAVLKEDGTYEIPEGKEDEYNKYTKEYQSSVNDFNSYWSGRQAEINAYNAATKSYNENVTKNNQALNEFLKTYNLNDYMKENNIPAIPNQTAGTPRNISQYPKEIDAPPTVDKAPASVVIYPPPPVIKAAGEGGVPNVAKPADYPSRDAQELYGGVYDYYYAAENIPGLDQNIDANVAYWAYLNALSIHLDPLKDTVPDPILNFKPLFTRIMPEAFVDISVPQEKKSLVSSLGLDSAPLQDMLNRDAIKEIVKSFDLKLTEQQINTLTDRLLILTVGLLSDGSLQALFPGLSLISNSLPGLPKDHPALGVLFAISLVNRIQEMAQLGLTKEAVITFLKGNKNFPQLANLTDTQITQLTSLLNIGMLLSSTKLLEINLGLPGLSAQVLPLALYPTESPALSPESTEKPTETESLPLVREALVENKQSLIQLGDQVQSHFVAQGYPPESARFLGETAMKLAEQGLTSPTVPTVSSANINTSLLTDSVQAGILLSQGPTQSLSKAQETSQQAVNQTISDGPYMTTNQFRAALETNIQSSGIKGISQAIAREAVIVPAAEKSLWNEQVKGIIGETQPAAGRIQPAQGAAAVSPLATPIAKETPIPPLTNEALMTLVKKRVQQLVLPQHVEQITEEIKNTLFGKNEGPFSLIQQLKTQLQYVQKEENKEFATAISKAFKETIKTSVDFYAFSLKMMDPLAAYTMIGIMYSHQGSKRGDIFI